MCTVVSGRDSLVLDFALKSVVGVARCTTGWTSVAGPTLGSPTPVRIVSRPAMRSHRHLPSRVQRRHVGSLRPIVLPDTKEVEFVPTEAR